jgi:hypothetical protein
MDGMTMTGYDAVVTSIFIRGLIGVAAVTASVAVAGCSAPEQQSLGEFVRNAEINAFCEHILDVQPKQSSMESFTANPNLDDAEELRRLSADYSTKALHLAPDEIADAVRRSAPGLIDLIDQMVSTGFDPSLIDPAEQEDVARSVEDSLAAADEIQVWVDANC